MKRLFVKLMSVLLILTLFGSCMTVTPENRDEAFNILKKRKRVLISKPPFMENSKEPVFRIRRGRINHMLMAAGQMGIELGYKYFVITSYSYIEGVEGPDSITAINVAYTNDENHKNAFKCSDASALLDGYKFTTQKGVTALWILFGTFSAGGLALELSSIGVGIGSSHSSQKYWTMFGVGIGMMLGASLFSIPIGYEKPPSRGKK
jgi:hypothetical protein